MEAESAALLWVLVAILVAAGVAGIILPALPGVALIFGGLWLGAWIDGYARVSGGTVILLAVLTLLAWLVDFVAAALGARRAGATRGAIIGAALGTVVGIFFGIPGLLLGPFVGAVLGELSNQRSLEDAARTGLATWLGLLVGTAAKLGIAFAMLGIFAFAFFVD